MQSLDEIFGNQQYSTGLDSNSRASLDEIFGQKDSYTPDTSDVNYKLDQIFKTATPTEPEKKQMGFFESLWKEPVKTLLVRPAVRAGQAFAAPIVEKFGNEEQKNRFYEEIQKDTEVPGFNINVEGQKTGTEGAKQIAGDAFETAAYLFPYGRAAKALTGVSTAAKLSPGVSSFLGKVGSGGLGGYAFDVARDLQENKSLKETLTPGMGTITGALIPTVPYLYRGGKRVAQEALGLTTGTGYGTIKEAGKASMAGGAQRQAFQEGLRGHVTPEKLVEETRDALATMKQQRTEHYLDALKKISKDKTSLDISPIGKEIDRQLRKFNIRMKDGVLDFSRSSIRFDKGAQSDVTNIVEAMKNYGSEQGDRLPIQVDQLKRAFGDLYSDSSNVRAFVQAVKAKTSEVLEKVKGYTPAMRHYEQYSNAIDDIQRGLSLGDKAMVETSFKKITSALRQNNEFRKIFIQELDDLTGGTLLPKIAGYNLSSVLPKGLSGTLEGVGAAGGLLTHTIGVGTLLKSAFIASPRIVGEIINALGLPKNSVPGLTNFITRSISNAKFPGDAFLESNMAKSISKYVKNPKVGMSIEDVSKKGYLPHSSPANPQSIKNVINPKSSIPGIIPQGAKNVKVSELRDVRGKTSSGNYAVDITEKIPFANGKGTRDSVTTKYFFKKEDATKWINENKQGGFGKVGALATTAAGLGLAVHEMAKAKQETKTQEIPQTIYNKATSPAEKKYGIKFPKKFLEAIREQESSNIDDPTNLRLSMGLTDIAMEELGDEALPNTSMENVMKNAANYLALRSTHVPEDGGPNVDMTKPENWIKWYVQKYVGLMPGKTRNIRGEEVPYQKIYDEFERILKRKQNEQETK